MQYTSSIGIKLFGIASLALLISLFVYQLELVAVIALFTIPAGGLMLYYLMGHPSRALDMALVFSFLAIGLIRYIGDVPFGLTVDFSLLLAFLVALFQKQIKTDYSKLKNGLVLVTLVWMVYCIAELFNPQAVSSSAWLYAVRGLALYMFLTIPLTLLYANKVADLDRFIKFILIFSVLASIWGLKQFIFGPDQAEINWLNEGKNRNTHVLNGVLRIFSFF